MFNNIKIISKIISNTVSYSELCKMFVLIFTLFITDAFSQDGDHINGGHFSKSIEYNRLYLGELGYNLNNKEDIEKLFWGKYNAPIEFLYSPPTEIGGYSGFRIIMDSAKLSYILEVKYITNFKEARDAAAEKYPLGITPVPVSMIGKMQNLNYYSSC